jgi:hypothetical protein
MRGRARDHERLLHIVIDVAVSDWSIDGRLRVG